MSNEHETILVTGAAGFIGANLCRRLVEEGQRVHAVVREASRMWRLSDVLDRLVVHEADI
ncbi:MAG TPA: NAD-dependent epimerase/dehydratase family protein, partial [Candidatus Hydrogenedentes bacterium]|nr:NAD-dependent epimerase/dehydratase family protein [Candidatus Hydrogenedentota bacterium]